MLYHILDQIFDAEIKTVKF